MVIIVEYPFFGKYVSTECLTYVCEFQFTYIYEFQFTYKISITNKRYS